MTQNNLGNAYSRRLKGDQAQNIQEAIAPYQKALQVITQEKLPQQWATIQNNLGNTYLTKTTGNNRRRSASTASYYSEKSTLQVGKYLQKSWHCLLK